MVFGIKNHTVLLICLSPQPIFYLHKYWPNKYHKTTIISTRVSRNQKTTIITTRVSRNQNGRVSPNKNIMDWFRKPQFHIFSCFTTFLHLGLVQPVRGELQNYLAASFNSLDQTWDLIFLVLLLLELWNVEQNLAELIKQQLPNDWVKWIQISNFTNVRLFELLVFS